MKVVSAIQLVPGKRYYLTTDGDLSAEFQCLDANGEPQFINQRPNFFAELDGIVYLCGQHVFYEKEVGDE